MRLLGGVCFKVPALWWRSLWVYRKARFKHSSLTLHGGNKHLLGNGDDRAAGKLLLLTAQGRCGARWRRGAVGRAVPTSLFPACASSSPRCQPLVKTKDVIAALPAPLRGKGWKMSAPPDARRRVGVRGGAARRRRCRRGGRRGVPHSCTCSIPLHPQRQPVRS